MGVPNLYEVCIIDEPRDIKTSLGFYTSKTHAEMDCNILFMTSQAKKELNGRVFKIIKHKLNCLTPAGMDIRDESFDSVLFGKEK